MQENIEALAKQVCDELNFYLIEVKIRGNMRQPIFEIYADTEQGITLKECEMLTRELQDRIDMSEQYMDNYRINVSSPGLDKSLVQDFEFRRNIGQQLIIKFQSADKIVEKTGELTGFDDVSLNLSTGGITETISRADIKEAKVKIKW